MPCSLNAVDKEIIYDTNIDYYIDLYKFAGELVFSFRLPDLLFHISDCYCIETGKDAFDLECLRDSRRVIIAGTRNWISYKDILEKGTYSPWVAGK